MESSSLDRQSLQKFEDHLRQIKQAYEALCRLVDCKCQVGKVADDAEKNDIDSGHVETTAGSSANLRSEISPLASDEAIENVRNDPTKVKVELDSVSKELDAEKSKNRILEGKLENANLETDTALKDNEDLQLKYGHLEEKYEKALDETATARKEIEKLLMENEELTFRVKEVQQEREKYREDFNTTNKKYRQYKEKYQDCEACLREKIAENSKINQDFDQVKQLLGTSKEELKQKDAESLRIGFGDIAGERPDVVEFLNRIFVEVKKGVRGAIGLSGRLMALQTCTVKAYPGLLKEIGDAYYVWKPRDEGSVTRDEELLVRFLHSQISKSGARNTVKLVECGDRFDASLHASETRGVEVAAVRGWIVLRENGDPIVRAGVLLR